MQSREYLNWYREDTSNQITSPAYIKKSLLNQQGGSDVAARRRAGTLNAVQKTNHNQGIYNKAAYAGTNDGYNAWHSLAQVRNLGATVPLQAQRGTAHVNTFFGQSATAGSATKDAKSSQTLDRNVPNEGRQNF